VDPAETLLEDSKGSFICWNKLSGESKFRKNLWYRLEQTIRILLFTSF
jgi:hypothetical protein